MPQARAPLQLPLSSTRPSQLELSGCRDDEDKFVALHNMHDNTHDGSLDLGKPLCVASKEGHEKIVRKLLEARKMMFRDEGATGFSSQMYCIPSQ